MNLTSKQMLSGKETDTKISLQNKRNIINSLIIVIIIKTLFHDGENTLQPGAEKLVALIG